MKKTAAANPDLTVSKQTELLGILRSRFEKNPRRHPGVTWDQVAAKLETAPEKLVSLNEMEITGGEPDVVVFRNGAEVVFCDCAPESPVGRRSLCYDREALESRKENKPRDSALSVAVAMGIDLLTEEEYRELQKLGKFDVKTSSWVSTPAAIRGKGGAVFCDRRYDTVFCYHNGAESYYAARGFRGSLKL